jgi:PBSX family phage portal protein
MEKNKVKARITSPIWGESDKNHPSQLLEKTRDTSEGQKALDISETSQILNTPKIIEPKYSPDQLVQLFDTNPHHARCCRTKSIDTVGRGYQIVMDDVDGEEVDNMELFREEKKKVLRFLKNCYNRRGFSELMKDMSLDYFVTGYTTAEIIRKLNGDIKDIIHVRSSDIRIVSKKYNKKNAYLVQIKDANNYVYFVRYGNMYYLDENEERQVDKDLFVNSEDIEKKEPNIADRANEMIFLSNYAASSPHYGICDVIPALGSITNNLFIERYLTQYFENKAIPRYVVIVENGELDDEVFSSIERYFKEEIKGNHHATLILQSGKDATIKMQQLEQGTEKGPFQDVRINNRDDILVAHGVTPAIVGIIDSGNIGGGSGEAQLKNYNERVIRPHQKMIADLFTSLLKEGLGVKNVRLKFLEVDTTDRELDNTVLKDEFQNSIITRNEWRKEIGLEPIEDKFKDSFFMKSGNLMVPIDYLEFVTENGKVGLRILENIQNSTTGDGADDNSDQTK